MKKFTSLMAAALLSASLFTLSAPVTSYAASPAPTVSSATTLPQGQGFLNKTLSLTSGTYVPYRLTADDMLKTETLPDELKPHLTNLPIGQLQLKQDTSYKTAFIYDWSYPIPSEKESDFFRPLFAGNSSKTTIQTFNQLLPQADTTGNQILRQFVTAYNQKQGTQMPADIFSFSLRNTTPISSFGNDGYTLASRIIAKADGWTIPFYIKAYVWKKDGEYRLLAALAADSEWDSLLPLMDELAEKAMGN